ncbi:MAG: hypothetical protein HY454_01420 [Parcubacteria group bacterium]|nr:hypothetical protein [Parcubacteria group bacterium]
MTLLQWVNTIIIAIGIPTIAVALINIGKKLHLLKMLEQSTERIKHNLKVISDYLTRYHTKFDPKELGVLSPLNLTQEGRDLIARIGFDNIFERNRKDFLGFIDSESPKLKYDAEVAAVKSIYFLQDRPYMEFLKVYLYNNPSRNLENIAPTLGVYVRDQYLSEHPEITQ